MNFRNTLIALGFIALCFILQDSAVSGDRNGSRNERLTTKQQDADHVMSTIPYNTNTESVVFSIYLDPGFSTDSLIVGPEILTNISGFYDYKTNGEANVYIQVDPLHPDTIHTVDVIADSSDFTGATTRRSVYTFSTNGGLTWEFNTQVPDGVRSGYPVIQLLNSSAVIANHNTNSGNRLDANLYVDIAPLAGTFTEYPHSNPVPWAIWPQTAALSNGNVSMIARRNSGANGLETLFVSTWNGTNLSAYSPIYFTTGLFQTGVTIGSNMRFHIATNGAGRVTVIAAPVTQADTLDNSKVFSRTSTDNGVTWGPVLTVFAPHTINGGADTVFTVGGSGFTCKPGSDMWFYACPITNDPDFYGNTKLIMTRSDGTVSTITTTAQVGATTTFAQTMSFVWNIDFPSLGWSADGSTLYCVYSVVMPDVASSGYNQRDIFCQYSLDNGATWSNPLRLTNTINIDETYPSVSSWNKGTNGGVYELNIIYMKDPGVGPASFGGSAPTSRNRQVFRKLIGVSPIGIINNQNLLKDYHLTQNYPNPFNPSTKIEYNLIKAGLVTLKVYDILGREVAVLVNEVQNAGVKEIEFNASDLTSGIYFYTINSGDFKDTKKMILVK